MLRSGTRRLTLTLLLLLGVSTNAVATHEMWVQHTYPQDQDKWWWDDDWWEHGLLPVPRNHQVVVEEASYDSGADEIPVTIYRPAGPGPYPGVLFQHGRRGLDDLTGLHPRRLAARGFVVVAPDIWGGRFMNTYPIGHDYTVEKDVAKGIEFLMRLSGLAGDRVCVVSHTRGGYMTLKALVNENMQEKGVACYVSYYPHFQDPNLPEPAQIYGYEPAVEKLMVPALIFFGEHEQYQRYRPILEVAKFMAREGRDFRVIVYPGVGRGFDFRPPNVRVFADDLAAKDAMMRTATFIRHHLLAP